MSTDAKPADSSSAPAQNPNALSSLTGPQYDRFMATGELPEEKVAEKKDPPTPPADSSAAPVKAEDEPPASSADPTKPADSSPAKPEKRTDPRATENRVPELLAERAQLRSELDSLRRELQTLKAPPKSDAPPAPSAPAQPETFPTYDQWLEKHPDGAYESYLDERSDFRVQQGIEKALKARDETTAQEQARRSFVDAAMKRTEQFVERITAAKAEDPAFWDGLSADVKALKPLDDIRDPETGQWTERPTPYHWITQRIIESPQAPQFLKHFSDHPEDLHRIAKLQPDDAREALAELRVGFKAKSAAPPIKHVSDAPPPAPSLGKRPTTPTDPVDAAVARRDYSAYESAANAADLAPAGRR